MQSFVIRVTGLLLLSLSFSAHAVTDGELKEAAAAVNQQAPMMVDEETRLDGADSGNQSLTYNYTLVNYAADELDGEKFAEALQPTLLKAGCDALRPLLSQGVTVHYVYRGKNKGAIASLVLTAKDCGL